MPVMDIDAHPDVAVAMDFMTVNLADLTRLAAITRPLDALFRREQQGWEQDEDGADA